MKARRAMILPWLAGLLAGTSLCTAEEIPAPARPEGFVALVGGHLSPDGVHVSATESCFLFCVPVSVSRDTRYGNIGSAGVRLGLWGTGTYRQLGAALSMTHVTASGDEGGVRYDTLAVSPQLRAGPFTVNGFTITPYLGFHLAGVMDGHADVRFPEFTHTVSGALKGSETGLLAGVALAWRRVGILVETRRISTRLNLDDIGSSGSINMDSSGLNGGMFWRF